MDITLPAHFDAAAFEVMLRGLSGDWTQDVDAAPVRTATPAATVSLLALGDRHSGLPASWIRQQFTPAGALLPPLRLFNPADLDQVIYVLDSHAVREPLHWLGFPEAEGAAVVECVGALVRNVFEHAGGAGWLAAWTLPDGSLEAAVVDGGRGFGHSLRQRADEPRGDGGALLEAFAGGTSRREGRAGSGLAAVRRIVGERGGELSVWSGSARARETAGGAPQLEAGLPPFSGAQVVLRFPSRI